MEGVATGHSERSAAESRNPAMELAANAPGIPRLRSGCRKNRAITQGSPRLTLFK